MKDAFSMAMECRRCGKPVYLCGDNHKDLEHVITFGSGIFPTVLCDDCMSELITWLCTGERPLFILEEDQND